MAPLIEFDTTLKDLYELGTQDHAEIYHFYAFPTSAFQTVRGLPVCTKYAYQDDLWPKDIGFQARLFTQVVPQWFSMIAGQSNVIMLDLDVVGGDGVDLRPREDTVRLHSCVAKHQRPKVTYVRDASEVTIPDGASLSVLCPADCLERFPALIPYDVHYFALSKRELALSDIPSPPSVVVDSKLGPDQVSDQQLRHGEVARQLDIVKETTLPFVIKLPQARGGFGTLIVQSEADRTDVVATLSVQIDRILLQLNHDNAHLRPASFVVQDMIPGSTAALSMFVPQAGSPMILCVTNQMEDENGTWTGSHVDYSRQSALKNKYMPIAEAVASHLRRLGYHGPVGADVMTNAAGEHFVIDLNSRVTASHIMGLTKGHFSVERGLDHVAIITPIVDIGLAEFETEFKAKRELGSVVVIGWCHGPQGGKNIAAVMVGAESKELLLQEVGGINSFKTHSFTSVLDV